MKSWLQILHDLGFPEIAGEDMLHHWGFLDPRGKVVLDVGCASGDSPVFFWRRGASRIYGVDINQDHVEKAREVCSALGVDADFIVADADTLSFWESVLSKPDFDLCKVDCEGGERWLAQLSPMYLANVPVWAVEVHNPLDIGPIVNAFRACGYAVTDWPYYSVHIVYAVAPERRGGGCLSSEE